MPAIELRTLKGCCTAVAICLLAVGSASAEFIDLTPSGDAINSNDSVVLQDLLDAQVDGIIVGDKVFSGFSYSRIGDMPEATSVNVLGFRDLDGNWGVSFHGTFLDLPGDDERSDALIRFIVEIDEINQQRGWVINDAHLFLGGVGSDEEPTLGDESFFGVDETFLGSNESLSVLRTTLNGQTDQILADWVDFEQPRTRIAVTKDIIALAAPNADQPARATVIDQSFSQTIIPEPATCVLGALSCLGLLALRRRG